MSAWANDVFVSLGLLAPSFFCACTDLSDNLILNVITMPMAILGLIYSAFSGRIVMSLLGVGVGFGIMLVGYLSGQVAGGDVKMAGAIGAWLGLGILQAILVASVIGLIWGAIRLRKAGTLKSRATMFFRGIYCRLVYGMQGVVSMGALPDGNNTALPPEALPFGACLAAGAWITFILSQTGWLNIVWK